MCCKHVILFAKLANIKRYSVDICLLIKEASHETAKMSVSGVKLIWNIANGKYYAPNGLEVALLRRLDRQRMVYRLWNSAKDRICRKAHLGLLIFYFSDKHFKLSIRILLLNALYVNIIKLRVKNSLRRQRPIRSGSDLDYPRVFASFHWRIAGSGSRLRVCSWIKAEQLCDSNAQRRF